jgi:hypothetical protein
MIFGGKSDEGANKSEPLLLFGTATAKNHWRSQMIFGGKYDA